jgi:hypothetical protein
MIIFINGSINAGKSTVAEKLAKKFEKPALIEIDNIGAFIDWMDIDDAVPINLENAVSVIRNLSKRGFTCVVPYPLSEKDYKYVMDGLSDLNEDIQVFTLSPKIEKAQSDTADRKIGEWERARIQHHYDIGIPSPSFGVVIDNTNESPDETVERIFEIIRASQTST